MSGMKTPARIGLWLLPLLLTGCFHRSHTAQSAPLAPAVTQPQQTAPVPEPAKVEPPAPKPVEPAQPLASTNQTATNTTPTNETPRPPVHHTPKKPVNPHPQVASNGAVGVSAIGQLSSGDPGDSRRQTEDSLSATERGLRGINRQLNDQEQRTMAHIREFLKQARQALASGDLDGAHTLAAKARVLLNELSR
jgi:hypothetical protein